MGRGEGSDIRHLPPAEAGSLQLTPKDVRVWPNDSGPAEASHEDQPCRGYRTNVLTLGILPQQRFLPGTLRMFSWQGTVCKPFAPPEGGVPKHTDKIAYERRAAFIPTIHDWGFLPRFL